MKNFILAMLLMSSTAVYAQNVDRDDICSNALQGLKQQVNMPNILNNEMQEMLQKLSQATTKDVALGSKIFMNDVLHDDVRKISAAIADTKLLLESGVQYNCPGAPSRVEADRFSAELRDTSDRLKHTADFVEGQIEYQCNQGAQSACAYLHARNYAIQTN
jgi:hypothetical protein